MRLTERQITKALNGIIRRIMTEEGRFPSVRQVRSELSKLFGSHSPGEPIFKPRLAKYRRRSSSDDWNQMSDELSVDLATLYSDNIENVNKLVADFEWFEQEKMRLLKKLKETDQEITEMLLLSANTNSYFASASDTFKSLSKVDTQNTTAWVDLEGQFVSLPVASKGNHPVDLSGLEIKTKLLTPATSERHIQNPGEALDGELGTAWVYEVMLSRPGVVRVSFEITGTIKDAARITVVGHNPAPTSARLLITRDQRNWIDLGEKSLFDRGIWDFSRGDLLGIKVILEQETTTEQAVIGLKEIQALGLGFEKGEGDPVVLQSKSLNVKDAAGKDIIVSKVVLEVEEEIPTDASIEYEVALDSENPDWQPVTPVNRTSGDNKVFDLKRITKQSPMLFTNSAGLTQIGPYNGLYFYQLGSAPMPTGATLIKDSVQLFKGVGQWRVDTYYYEREDGEDTVPERIHWSEIPTSYTTKYETVGDSLSLPSGSNDETGLHRRFLSNFYLTGDQQRAIPLEVESQGEVSVAWRMFINNQEIDQGVLSGKRKLNVLFQPGWNTVEILIYRHNDENSTLSLGSNLSRRASKVYARTAPLRQTDDFNLFYNVKEKDTETFAIQDGTFVVGEYQKDQGADYHAFYSYYTGGTEGEKLLLKATFKGSDGPPPKLHRYTLRASREA